MLFKRTTSHEKIITRSRSVLNIVSYRLWHLFTNHFNTICWKESNLTMCKIASALSTSGTINISVNVNHKFT